jgi:hypothetical protein
MKRRHAMQVVLILPGKDPDEDMEILALAMDMVAEDKVAEREAQGSTYPRTHPRPISSKL